MRNLLAIFLILISTSYTSAYNQTNTIDSLISFLNNYTKKDTVRVNALIDLVRSYQKVDLEEGKRIAKEAEKISKEINYPLGIANSLYNLGFYYWNIGNNDTSILICTEALKIFKNINSFEGQLKCYNRIGVNYYLTGNYNKAIDFYYKALELVKFSTDKLEIANLYNNIGVLFGDLNDYEKAIEYSLKALHLKNSIQDSFSIGISLCNVGIFYLRADNYKNALTYLRQSLNLNSNIKSNYTLSETYEGLGSLYDLLGKYDSAYYFHQKGLDLVLKYGSYGQISRAYNSIGNHYLIQNNLKKALEYGTKALNVGTTEKEHILNSYQLLYQTYAKLNDYKKSYQYLLAYKELNDKFKRELGLKKISIQEKEFQIRAIEEKAKLEIEYIEQKRFLTLVGLLFSIIIIILISYTLILKSRKNTQLKRASETRDKMMKIISHDFRSPLISLGSTLQIIPELIDNKYYDEVKRLSAKDSESVSRVLSLIDNLISWTLSQTDKIPYNPELYNLRKISSFIFDLYNPIANYKKIELINNIPEDIKIIADKNILNTVLRNLVNNAIKFTHEGGEVRVTAEQNASNVSISVIDTGKGIEKGELESIFEIAKVNKTGTKGEKGNGFGLFFCKEFAVKNKGNIYAESTLGKGSKFTFTVPKADS